MARYVPGTYNNRRVLRVIFGTIFTVALMAVILFIVLFIALEHYIDHTEEGELFLDIPWLRADELEDYPVDGYEEYVEYD